MTLTTPALLFPAISLLLLAYTNRFLVLSQIIRKLADEEKTHHQEVATRQIELLHKRVVLTKYMQVAGVLTVDWTVPTPINSPSFPAAITARNSGL